MSAHLVDVDPRQYLIADDFASVYQALVTGSLAEEADGAKIERDVTITADVPGITALATTGGFFVAAGYPDLLSFPLNLTLTFSAPGFDATSRVVVIAANSVVDLGIVALRRKPVRLQGRVLDAITRAPIGGALVVSAPGDAVALRTPLHFDHAAGIAVNQRSLNPAGAATQLTAIAPAGVDALDVASAAGIAVNSIVRIGTDALAECVVVASVNGSQIGLTAPLRRSFAAVATVQMVTSGAIGSTQNLARQANAGDGLLLLTGPMTADAVEIADGSATEYAFAGALTDAQGFYGLDAIGGVASIDLRASAGGFNPLQAAYSLDYNRPVNVVDFRLS